MGYEKNREKSPLSQVARRFHTEVKFGLGVEGRAKHPDKRKENTLGRGKLY